MTSNKTEFQLFTETWTKDSIDLVDYESKSFKTSSYTTTEPFFAYFLNNEVAFTKKEISSYKQLFRIGITDSNYYINTNKYIVEPKTHNDKGISAWFVYKTSKCPEKGKCYLLNQGDIIKIGRIAMIVKEIRVNNTINRTTDISRMNSSYCSSNVNVGETNIHNNKMDIQQHKQNINFMQSSMKMSVNLQKTKRTCRICYTDDNTEESPLIQPCQCSGSLKYIHLACLRKWIEMHLCVKVDSNEDYANYLVRNVECELCKVKFPDMIRHNGKLYELINFHSDFNKYIILEGLTVDKNNNKNVYVVSFDNVKKINVGRGHDAHLLLNDISVSRVHCFLYQEGKNVYIEDNDSKFGTLILIQNPKITLYSSVSLHFQVGRSYFWTKIKEPFSLFNCCNVSIKVDEKEYQRQNSSKLSLEHNHTVKEEQNYDESEYESEYNYIHKDTEKEDIIKMSSSINESNEDKGIIITNVRHQDTLEIHNEDNQSDINNNPFSSKDNPNNSNNLISNG